MGRMWGKLGLARENLGGTPIKKKVFLTRDGYHNFEFKNLI